MARLLDLPDELLDMIVKDHLLGVDDEERLWSPWPGLPRPSRKQSERKDLSQLVKASRRFHNLYQGLLYTDVALYNSELQFSDFLNTVEKSPTLAQRTVSLITVSPNSKDNFRFFSLPNLAALEIKCFREWRASVPDPTRRHTSSVQHLYLPSCSAVEVRLAKVLAYPAALKSLDYEYSFHEYDLLFEDLRHGSWTSESFLRALSSQRTTLERLTFTRTKQVAAEIVSQPAIDLSDFTALRTLSITWAILKVRRGGQCHDRMPPLLEHLQVLYDEGIHDDNGVFDEDWAWLKGLVRNKTTLKNIDILSTQVPRREDNQDHDEEEYSGQRPGRSTATASELQAAKFWSAPLEVKSEAAEACISLTFTLGYGVRLKSRE